MTKEIKKATWIWKAGIGCLVMAVGEIMFLLQFPYYIISVVIPFRTLCGFLLMVPGTSVGLYYIRTGVETPVNQSRTILIAFIISLVIVLPFIYMTERGNSYVSLFRYSSGQTVLTPTTLEKSIDRLLSTLSEPDKLTLNEIKSVVTETQVVLKQLRMETGEKTEALASIEEELKKARESGLTEEQYKAFMSGLGMSSRGGGVRGFIFGVFMSLTAMVIGYFVRQGIKKSRP